MLTIPVPALRMAMALTDGDVFPVELLWHKEEDLVKATIRTLNGGQAVCIAWEYKYRPESGDLPQHPAYELRRYDVPKVTGTAYFDPDTGILESYNARKPFKLYLPVEKALEDASQLRQHKFFGYSWWTEFMTGNDFNEVCWSFAAESLELLLPQKYGWKDWYKQQGFCKMDLFRSGKKDASVLVARSGPWVFGAVTATITSITSCLDGKQ